MEPDGGRGGHTFFRAIVFVVRLPLCAWCDKPFRRQMKRSEPEKKPRGYQRYCSTECRDLAKAEYNKFYWRMVTKQKHETNS